MRKNAVVAGVGPGLGASLVRRFAAEGYNVGLLARSTDYLEELADEIRQGASGDGAPELVPVGVDLADPDSIAAGFAEVRERLGGVDLLVNHASGGAWKGIQEIEREEFEHAWRVDTRGAFLCCKEVVSGMLEQGAGTILFTGATSSIRGRGGAPGFSAAKFASRGLAQSLARELGPRGIHVALVVIDGQIAGPRSRGIEPGRDEETLLDPDAIADAYWHLASQQRRAWTLELDVRPHTEEF